MSMIMRRKMRNGSGWANVPIVTADAMRHGMREAAAYALLQAAGLLGGTKLSEAALRLLFSGGMVTGRGEASTIKLDQYRELCELVPSMALFGGCADNRVIPGRLTVQDALLVCEETIRYVPTWARNTVNDLCGIDTCRSHVEEVQRVRMDPTLQPQKRRLLSESSEVDVNKRLATSEQDSADDASVRDAKSTMMPRSMECVAQGSMFSWACEAIVNNDLERDTFHVAVGTFLSNPWVGGKRGTGHGKLRPVQARDVQVRAVEPASTALDVTALAGKVGDLFRAHVEERKDRIADFLGTVNA
ncbi:MAG: hypothetical protein GVY18_03580 [Bacteroidetes bacterium]|nr:hypothetical protein [Bacteroidota bacterium]